MSRVIFFDATDTKPGLELSDAWRTGSQLYRKLRFTDRCRGFVSWADAIEWLETLDDGDEVGGVDEIQYWGHGSPGAVWLAGEPLQVSALSKVRVKKLFWLRTCASFAGTAGHSLAKSLADTLRCRVAGHTYNIALLHSGLHSLRPGANPAWSSTEGWVSAKRMGHAVDKIASSGPFAPNTITFMHSSFPSTW